MIFKNKKKACLCHARKNWPLSCFPVLGGFGSLETFTVWKKSQFLLYRQESGVLLCSFKLLFSCYIGEGNGTPLQCSWVEDPRDGGAWWAAVYGVTQSWTRLKRLSNSSSSSSSVAKSCPALSHSVDCSMPGFPVLHSVPEFAQTSVYWVSDAIQPSHPLSPHSSPALSLCQHQGLFHWVSSLHQVAKELELQLQH